MTDYLCIECGEAATHFTSINGQCQTFYCAPHAPAEVTADPTLAVPARVEPSERKIAEPTTTGASA